MSERTIHGLRALCACAALQLTACMQGQADGTGDDDGLALEEPSAEHDGMAMPMHDGGMSMPMHDGGMDHPMDDHAHDGGMHAHDVDAGMSMDAPCSADYPRYRAGLSMKAGELTIVAVSMAPAPPRQRVPNDWVLQLFDAAGNPVTDATVDNASSYMSVHRHGGNTRPRVIPQPTPGQFKLDNIDFKMRGPWEVLFDVTRQGGTPTPITFKVCVE